MFDPREGVAADGLIITGAARARVPAPFEPLLAEVLAQLSAWPGTSVYLYGSVATGQARAGRSDVDLLAFGLSAVGAARVGAGLSRRNTDSCRGVEIGVATTEELAGDSDSSYGLRVFLRHYCVHLGGSTQGLDLPSYPADVRAVRGFNGDIGQHLQRWRQRTEIDDAAVLGRRVARKTLLAVAGLVSLAASTWTTDRDRAARDYRRWRPVLAHDLSTLARWAAGETVPGAEQVAAILGSGSVIEQVVEDFAAKAGLWPDPS